MGSKTKLSVQAKSEKAETTTAVATSLVEKETAAREAKTKRLRAARLSNQKSQIVRGTRNQ